MRSGEKPAISLLSSQDANLILGAGGSRAILASTGVAMACHLSGIKRWRTIGGVSGGSIPAIMLAAGVPLPEIVRQVVGIDFVSKLTPRVNLARVWWAFFVKNCLWKRQVGRGVLSSEKLGQFIESMVPTWPDNFWTVAVAGKNFYLLAADGIYLLRPDRQMEKISDKPAPVSTAIRATCAVPGIIDGVEWNGELLLDGALTGESCPTRIAKDYLDAASGGIIACDVGEEDATAASREHLFFRVLRRLLCGECCDPVPFEPTHSDGVVLIQPPPAAIATLDLKLSADQKWRVIMSGFVSAVSKLTEKGLLAGNALVSAQQISITYENIERTAKAPGELAERTQLLVAAFGLF